MISSIDQILMLKAIALGEKGRGHAPPNPWVACILAKGDRVIAEGYTQEYGSDHAEVHAIKQLKETAQGATAYVTLEPCCHHGKTPPCTEALINAGIRRAVIALEDPDSKVAGKGIAALRKAGIEVQVGVCKKEAEYSLAPYLHHRKTGLPFTILKVASSIDGCVAAKDHSSQWITGESSREAAHKLRAESQAILIGAKTAIHDSPSLTVRGAFSSSKHSPYRILLDSQGSVPAKGPLFDTKLAPTWVFTSEKTSKERIQEWIEKGAIVSIIEEDEQGLNLHAVLQELAKKGVIQLLVEGGGKILGSFLSKGLYQKIFVFVGPCFLGSGGIPSFNSLFSSTFNERIAVSLKGVERYREDVCLEYVPTTNKTTSSSRRTYDKLPL